MQKFTHLDSLDQPRKKKSKAPLVVLFVLALVATPPLFEVGKMNLARWGLFGLTSRVETPILDTIGKHWHENDRELREWITPFLVNRRWNPQFVLPIAFFWTIVAAMMLRRGH
jgi:hypothetical protein